MYCVKCGKEIPDDANICPYCMTKTVNGEELEKNEQINVSPAQPVAVESATKKSKKKIIMIIVAVILVIAIVITSVIFFVNKKSDANNENTPAVKSENSVVNEDTGSLVSWANMKIDNPKLKLTDEQKAVLTYFDDDYFNINYNTKDLQKYPEIYKNAQISFFGTVTKLLKNTDEEYEALVEVSFDSNAPEGEHTNEFAVVYGKHPDNAKITKGDVREFYGRYTDDKQFTVDTKEDYYPYVNTFYSTETGYARGGYEDNAGKNFDFDFINKVAKGIFGNNIKVTDPDSMQDVNINGNFIPYPAYIVSLDNQSSFAFKNFVFARTNGYIADLRNFESVNDNGETLEAAGEGGYRLFVMADFEHFVITLHDAKTKHMYLDYYDKDLNKIWGREFSNVTDVPMDYTSKKIVLVADNDMYVIDTKTGKDLKDPLFVGSKSDVFVVEDGAILIGKEEKDAIMKVNLDGKILWTCSTSLCGEHSIPSIQLVDDKYIVAFGAIPSIAIAVDKDGNVIQEQEEPVYYDGF